MPNTILNHKQIGYKFIRLAWQVYENNMDESSIWLVGIDQRGHFIAQSIAKALAPMHIGVTTLAPGFVETEMAARLLDGPEGDGIRAQSPFNRVAKPEELAKAVYFLASPDSEWASGAVLDFNGASYLRM